MVYVINCNNKPLMPCYNVIARLLLKVKKAKVIRKEPFTIKLLYKSKTEYVQPCTLGIDTGSSKVGSSVVDENNNVLYLSEIEIRNDVTTKMKQRAMYRHSRRSRKTRHRPPRFLNRANSTRKNRFSPTMTSKINSHLKEIKFVKTILPISDIILETATFDPHLLKDPTLKYNKWGYQKGRLYGFSNMKAYILTRDNHTCQYCKGKSKDLQLQVHHIIFRSKGGSNNESNLITLCKTCHKKLHSGKIILKLKGKRKSQLKHATQMNSIRIQLLKRVKNSVETFGYITKENRQHMKLPKEHYFDAVAIASGGEQVIFKQNYILFKRCVPKGDYKQTSGRRSEIKRTTCKIQGFRRFDEVIYDNITCFIKGRMSHGYAKLMDIFGNKLKFKHTAKFSKMKRISSRKSWMISKTSFQVILGYILLDL